MPKPLKESNRISGIFESRTTVNDNGPAEKFIELPSDRNDDFRMTLIDRAEGVVLNMLRQITSGEFPKLTYSIPGHRMVPDLSKSTNDDIFEPENDTANAPDFDDNLSVSSNDIFDGSDDVDNKRTKIQEDEETAQPPEILEKILRKEETTVSYASKRSRTKLTLMATVLARSHLLMNTGSTHTRRSLYYGLQTGPTSRLAPVQRCVDVAVNHVSSLLECSPWDLGFVATSKGLVSGDLHLTLSDNETINCTIPGGALIPQNIQGLTFIRSTANYIIIVEKDAVFQKLLDEECPQYLNCILVTGKGYPDVVTRMLVKLLWEKLHLPVYALVDADPFGMEIMCIYRFGSTARLRENQDLVCPDVQWLGIHPTELIALAVSPEPLTDLDNAKLKALEKRPYMNETLLKQLYRMKMGKAEIEAVAGFSQRFLTTVYLPCKIKSKDHI